MGTSEHAWQSTESAMTGKRYSALVLDSGAFLSDSVSPSSIQAQAQKLYTTPSVIAEIKDSNARARFELQWLPFLTIKTAGSYSMTKIIDIAKKSGDKEVLSSTDLGVLALALELEIELQGNEDWLRGSMGVVQTVVGGARQQIQDHRAPSQEDTAARSLPDFDNSTHALHPEIASSPMQQAEEQIECPSPEFSGDTSDDEDGWITPSNIRSHQLQDNSSGLVEADLAGPVFVACATHDFAMQNVLLQLPIPVVTPNSPNTRITSVRSWLLRCHACFFITRMMSHQFCPRCGGPTLLRTSYTTDAKTGETRLFLKKDFQWNKRGNIYSIPKPTGGRASGKDGQGVKHELLLRGDQKEYVRQKEELERINRKGERDLMDKDYLPGILTGERAFGRGKVQIGHGRKNPNAKKSGKRK